MVRDVEGVIFLNKTQNEFCFVKDDDLRMFIHLHRKSALTKEDRHRAIPCLRDGHRIEVIPFCLVAREVFYRRIVTTVNRLTTYLAQGATYAKLVEEFPARLDQGKPFVGKTEFQQEPLARFCTLETCRNFPIVIAPLALPVPGGPSHAYGPMASGVQHLEKGVLSAVQKKGVAPQETGEPDSPAVQTVSSGLPQDDSEDTQDEEGDEEQPLAAADEAELLASLQSAFEKMAKAVASMQARVDEMFEKLLPKERRLYPGDVEALLPCESHEDLVAFVQNPETCDALHLFYKCDIVGHVFYREVVRRVISHRLLQRCYHTDEKLPRSKNARYMPDELVAWLTQLCRDKFPFDDDIEDCLIRAIKDVRRSDP